MTEAEWLACADPDEMERCALLPRADRALWLFGCACCRRVWHLLADVRSRALVELRERQADGLAVSERDELAALAAAKDAAHEVARALHRARAAAGSGAAGARRAAEAAVFAADAAYLTAPGGPFASHLAAEAVRSLDPVDGAVAYARERAAHCDLLRDIVGPRAFRLVAFSSEWRTDTALALAEQMYAAHDFSAMPILADALQDAGCDSAEVLNNCRDPQQVHVPGCWVIDLVLGKE